MVAIVTDLQIQVDQPDTFLGSVALKFR